MKTITSLGMRLGALALWVLPLPAAMLHLTVTDPDGQALPGVNVVADAAVGGATNLEGLAILNGISGHVDLELTCVGFEPLTLHLDLPLDGHVERRAVLQPTTWRLQDLTITTRRTDGLDLRDGRATEVLDAGAAAALSLDGGVRSALGAVSGIDTRPCGLCGSAGVGLQGLDPNYTEIQVDGLTLMTGVGALYGMDGVGVGGLSSLAVTRGAVGAEEGAGAVAGGVQLSSRRADGRDTLQVRLSVGDGWRHGAGITAGRTLAGLPMLLNADWQADPQRIDRNGDDLTDTPQLGRLGGQLGFGRAGHALAWNVSVAGLGENRFAGDTDWEDGDQGLVYGRDIATRRAEVRASAEGLWENGATWNLAGAWVRHHQDSWYGATAFDATQRRWLTQAALTLPGTTSTRLQAGWTDDFYEDGLGLPTDRHDRVPHLAASRNGMTGPVSWEAGLRAEKQQEGWIPLARGSVAVTPTESTVLRFSVGQGYRPITLFSLDKAVHAGFDHVDLPERLDPERSLSLNLGLQQQRVLAGGRWQGNLGLFAVEFRDKAVLLWQEEVGHLSYGNAERAFSRGVEARGDLQTWNGWRLAAGATWSRVELKLPGGWRAEELAGSWTANATLARQGLLGLDHLGGQLRWRGTGPQEMPEGRGRDKTPAWSVLDLGLDWRAWSWSLGLDVENLLDYVQPDNPLVHDANHEGMLDSALIYGPLVGRRLRLRAEFAF